MTNSIKVIIAASGLTILCLSFCLGLYVALLNSPQQARYQRYQYSTDNPSSGDNSVGGLAQPLEYREPCSDPKGKDESALCAQWRAAKASEESALFARWGFWVGIAGMIGLFWSLYYNRAAVRDAGNATKAAFRQTEIAEQSIRPWLEMGELRLTELLIQSRQVEIAGSIRVNNIGKSIARNIQISFAVRQVRGEVILNTPKFFERGGTYDTLLESTMMPDQTSSYNFKRKGPVIDAGINSVTLIVKIEYIYGVSGLIGMSCKHYDIRRGDSAPILSNQVFDCGAAQIEQRKGMERYE